MKELEIVLQEAINMKNTKVVKTEKVVKAKRLVTAVRDNTPVSSDFIEPEVKNTVSDVKPLKSGGKMEAVFKVLNGKNKVNIEDAIDQFLQIQTVNAKDPRKRVRSIFIQANQYRVPCKIEKVGKETYIELI